MLSIIGRGMDMPRQQGLQGSEGLPIRLRCRMDPWLSRLQYRKMLYLSKKLTECSGLFPEDKKMLDFYSLMR